MSLSVRQWDVVKVRINPERDRDTHPAVIISGGEICSDGRQLRLNVLFGSKKLPAVGRRLHGVLLNGADGLEFVTEVDCGFVHVVSKEKVVGTSGRVTPVRQREIVRLMMECWRFRV